MKTVLIAVMMVALVTTSVFAYSVDRQMDQSIGFAESQPDDKRKKSETSEQIVQGKRIIRVKYDTFNDVDYIDIREVWYNDDGELQYTKKGVAIKPDQVKDLIRALQKI